MCKPRKQNSCYLKSQGQNTLKLVELSEVHTLLKFQLLKQYHHFKSQFKLKYTITGICCFTSTSSPFTAIVVASHTSVLSPEENARGPTKERVSA